MAGQAHISQQQQVMSIKAELMNGRGRTDLDIYINN